MVTASARGRKATKEVWEWAGEGGRAAAKAVTPLLQTAALLPPAMLPRLSLLLAAAAAVVSALDNGLGATPAMGYSTWNDCASFRNNGPSGWCVSSCPPLAAAV